MNHQPSTIDHEPSSTSHWPLTLWPGHHCGFRDLSFPHGGGRWCCLPTTQQGLAASPEGQCPRVNQFNHMGNWTSSTPVIWQISEMQWLEGQDSSGTKLSLQGFSPSWLVGQHLILKIVLGIWTIPVICLKNQWVWWKPLTTAAYPHTIPHVPKTAAAMAASTMMPPRCFDLSVIN